MGMKYFCFLFIYLFILLQNANAQSVSELLSRLNETKDNEQKVSLYIQIGLLYQQEKAYSKAAEYFVQAQKNIVNGNKTTQNSNKEIQILEYLGTAQSLIPDYIAAIETYQILFDKQKMSIDKSRKNLNILADLHKRAEQYPQALVKYETILSQYPSNSQEQIVQTYNNIGFLYRQAGDNQKAKENLNKAL
ncbi:MAG: tetratricopeptide repeat protein, partial [Cytophagales bacterium]